ncbi:MAG: septation protein IspZ [Gammaproteobacteria bacterium]|nr:septation protein IspZ [Gammaproteobacteria bacterium]
MKLLFDTFPVLLFVGIYYGAGDLFLATGVAIAATILQVAIFWVRHRRLEKMHLISAALILVLGGLTIVLRDKAFIMWKPTLVNWAFAVVFLIPQLLGKKTLFERMAGHAIKVPDGVWRRANLMWVAFFLFAGAANIYFARDYQAAEAELAAALPGLSAQTFEKLECDKAEFANARALCNKTSHSEQSWVNFKLILIGLTFVYVLGIGVYLSRYMKQEDDTDSVPSEES